VLEFREWRRNWSLVEESYDNFKAGPGAVHFSIKVTFILKCFPLSKPPYMAPQE
jgi:hypothetical protein